MSLAVSSASPTFNMQCRGATAQVLTTHSITKREVQDQFRLTLGEMVKAYEHKYQHESEMAALYDNPQREELQNILLEFRAFAPFIAALRTA